MKTCPVCKATLFDDMEVCYGCMYSFGSKPELEEKARQGEEPEKEAAGTMLSGKEPAAAAREACAGESMPLALLAKAASTMPGWGIRFEMRDEAAPHQMWSMELTPPRAPAI